MRTLVKYYSRHFGSTSINLEDTVPAPPPPPPALHPTTDGAHDDNYSRGELEGHDGDDDKKDDYATVNNINRKITKPV